MPRELPDDDVDARLAKAMASDTDGGRFEPRRRGFLLPLGVIVFVVVALLLLVFSLSTTARDPFVAPDLQTRRFITTEWRLLEELESDLQFQLSVKEAEIARFQKEIESLNQRNRVLEDAIESSVDGRRKVLADERAATLERRRSELSGQGFSPEEVGARLSELRIELEDIDRRRLASYRRDVESDFGAQIEEVFEEREVVRRNLLEAQNEREELLRELTRTRAALETELETAQAAFSEERALLLRDLRALAEAKRQDEATLGAILGLYAAAVDAIDVGNYSEARMRLDDILSLDTPQERSEVDRALVGLLQEVVTRRETIAEESAAEQARQITGLNDRIQGLQRRLEAESAALEGQRETLADLDRSIRELERRAPAPYRSEGAATPGALLLDLVAALEAEAAEQGAKVGRSELAREIAILARYLRGERLSDATVAREGILAASAADPVFSGAAADVQELGVEGLSRPELPLGQRRLLGFVASRDGNRVEVELLGSLEAQRGQRIFVSEVAGTVEAVLADRVVAVIDAEDAGDVEFRDLVYVEIRPQ